MTILTTAQLDAAPKTQLFARPISVFATATSSMYRARQLDSGDAGFGVAAPTAAAIGAGGTLMGNGSAGFPVYPATDTAISGLLPYTDSSTNYGSTFLYDVIWMASGIAANSTAAQAVVGFPTLTRPDVNGTGLELFLFVRATAGSTLTTVTVSYTNSAGVAGRSATLRLSATTNLLTTIGALLPLRLQVGDTGVQSVQSITLGTAQAAAGNLCLVLARRLVQFKPSSNLLRVSSMDAFRVGLPPIGPNAALCIFAGVGGTNIGGYLGIQLSHG